MIEYIRCPYCSSDDSLPWAVENGFTAVKCKNCGFIYVNPRPAAKVIKHSVETGCHAELCNNKSAVARRVPRKIPQYRLLFKEMFSDIWGGADQSHGWILGLAMARLSKLFQGLPLKAV